MVKGVFNGVPPFPILREEVDCLVIVPHHQSDMQKRLVHPLDPLTDRVRGRIACTVHGTTRGREITSEAFAGTETGAKRYR